jgi:hypothetical protein
VTPVLSAPDRLEASASGSIGLPISLDGTDGVPPRSVIAVSGLPDGATLSHGRPYGDSGWNLKADEIGDLQINLPDTASGETKLAIQLVAPHGEVISSTETVIAVSADPEIAPDPSPEEEAADAVAAAGPVETPPAAAPETPPVIALNVKPVPLALNRPSPAPKEKAPVQTAEAAAADDSEPADEPKPSPGSAAKPMALAAASDSATNGDTVTPAAYVNLRDRPTARGAVLGVVPKGAKLQVLDRQRGWVQVTHPTTSDKGWIYAGNLAGASKRARRAAKPAETDESFWDRVGRAITGTPSQGSEQN